MSEHIHSISKQDVHVNRLAIEKSLLDYVPILSQLGISIEAIEPEQTKLRLDIGELNMGPYGTVLGFALMAAADTAAGIAAASAWRHSGYDEVSGFATQEFSTTFCRAARTGPVIFKTEIQHISGRRAVIHVDAHDLGNEKAFVFSGRVTIVRLPDRPDELRSH